MITAGIDMGAKTVKVVLCDEGRVLARAIGRAGFDAVASAQAALAQTLELAGICRTAILKIVATGVGREEVPEKDGTRTELSCAARGALALVPKACTVIDVGAEEGRVLRCNQQGRIIDFAINEKCAAGTGAFVEAMARALELPLEEMGPLSRKSTQLIPLNVQCVVFAESEVVSLIHQNVAKEDIARAVHEAIASRILSMVRKVSYAPPVVLIGGMAKNEGFAAALQQGLQLDTLLIPPQPEFCVALGAALAAAEEGSAPSRGA
jgi:benzoyl-CoA reductase subunit D